jgi:addiction module HigA family antidote
MSNFEFVSGGRPMDHLTFRSSITIDEGVSDMVRMPANRTPTHPGEMLLEEFLKPMNLTQQDLARSIRVPYQRVNELVHGRRGITPSTALRLSKYFGNSAGFWMNLQLKWDLSKAQETEAETLRKIHPVQAVG